LVPRIAQLTIIKSQNLTSSRSLLRLRAEMGDRVDEQVCDASALVAARLMRKVRLRKHGLLHFKVRLGHPRMAWGSDAIATLARAAVAKSRASSIATGESGLSLEIDRTTLLIAGAGDVPVEQPL
jgi:hypothetical protein